MPLSKQDQDLIEGMIKNDHFRKVILKCWEIYDRKGADYTRGKGDNDRLDNFRQASEASGVTLAQAWYVYAYKHWSSLIRFVKDGRVESEPIEQRCYDLINYVILLLIHIGEEASKAESKAQHAASATHTNYIPVPPISQQSLQPTPSSADTADGWRPWTDKGNL